jgi:hypothetical protein
MKTMMLLRVAVSLTGREYERDGCRRTCPGGGLADHHEYPGANDGADAKGGEADWPDCPLQLMTGLVGLLDQRANGTNVKQMLFGERCQSSLPESPQEMINVLRICGWCKPDRRTSASLAVRRTAVP